MRLSSGIRRALVGLAVLAIGSWTAQAVVPAQAQPDPIAVATQAGAALVDGVPAVIPEPTSETAQSGSPFSLDQQTAIAVAHEDSPGMAAVSDVAWYLRGLLEPATGLPLPVRDLAAGTTDTIVLERTGPAALGREGYTVRSDATSVVISGHTAQGLFRGVQTLRQLLPSSIESSTMVGGTRWTVPAVSIADSPRYGYRGVMVDVSRHFYTVAQLERVIDQAAMYKMNVLHLGLTNAQGWRIAISAYPTLTSIGASMPGKSAGYYTAADYQRIVDYARARFITVVPEIEGPAPAHTTAAVTAMANVLPIDPTNPADNANVRTFLTTVINEVAAATPSPYIHVGGDESSVTGAQYDNWTDAAIGAVRANGRTPIGWAPGIDSDPNVPAGSVYQYWLSTTATHDQTVADGLAKGSKILMSPTDATYFDYKYDASDPWGWTPGGYFPISRAYNWDPEQVLTSLTSGTGHTIGTDAILGVEAELWSDTVPVSADASAYADYQLLDRLPATAEVGWSSLSARQSGSGYDWASFASRLALQGQRWMLLDYQFYRSPEINWVGLPPVAPVVSDPPQGARLQVSPATISGSADAGNTVTVSEQGTTVCTATVAGDGTWSCTPTTALAAGSHTLSAVQTQPGVPASPAVSITFTVGAAPVLVDHWTMDGVSGSTVPDSVSGGYPGTVTGTTTFTPGAVGTAATFDGSASPITTGAPNLAQPWSVGVWVDPTAANTSGVIMSGADMALKVQQYNNTGAAGVTQYHVADYATDYQPALNTWTYLTFVDDGTRINVYANGAPVGTIPVSLTLDRASIGSPGGGDASREKLDELSIFSAPLSADQVAALYTSAQTGGTDTVK
jgi:hexosaminidase